MSEQLITIPKIAIPKIVVPVVEKPKSPPLDLVPSNHPALSAPVAPFDFEQPDSVVRACDIADVLASNMNHYKGLGLSANQLGLPFRAFVMRSDPITVCFNPRLVDTGEETALMVEGCLSYPGLHIKIARPVNIKVRYTLPSGEVTTKKLTGLSARIFQHEMDHMEGIDFLQRAKPLALEMSMLKWKKLKIKIQKYRKQ